MEIDAEKEKKEIKKPCQEKNQKEKQPQMDKTYALSSESENRRSKPGKSAYIHKTSKSKLLSLTDFLQTPSRTFTCWWN